MRKIKEIVLKYEDGDELVLSDINSYIMCVECQGRLVRSYKGSDSGLTLKLKQLEINVNEQIKENMQKELVYQELRGRYEENE